MDEKEECIFCKNLLYRKLPFGDFYNHSIYDCPLCGIYVLCFEEYDELFINSEDYIDKSNIASYLYYNKIDKDLHKSKIRNYIGTTKSLPYFQKSNGTSFSGKYTIIDKNFVANLRIKHLSEKESVLLKEIYKNREPSSDICVFTIPEIESAAFVIKTNLNVWENNYEQYMKILKSLESDGKIQILDDGKNHQQVIIKILTKGIKLIEEGDKNMSNSNSSNITNYGNMVLNSSVHNSIIGNGNSSTNFDYQALSSVISEIEKLYKQEESFSQEVITQIESDIKEIKIAIQQKNQPVIQKCLKNIGGFVTNISAGIIASGIWTKIQPFIQQIPGM